MGPLYRLERSGDGERRSGGGKVAAPPRKKTKVREKRERGLLGEREGSKKGKGQPNVGFEGKAKTGPA